MGRTIEAGGITFFEYLRIDVRDDGVFYVAQPLGRPPTEFKLVTLDAKSAVFENPQHDFPKRASRTDATPTARSTRVSRATGGRSRTTTDR